MAILLSKPTGFGILASLPEGAIIKIVLQELYHGYEILKPMKHHIERLLHMVLKQLECLGELPALPAFVEVKPTKSALNGDFSSNIAMILAKLSDKTPREVAESIVRVFPSSPYIQKIEIAGPGFINFFVTFVTLQNIVKQILTEKEAYGRCKIGRGKRILMEFLSSNPTGPLHVGHGRHAAFGIAVSNLLDAVGFKTYREYYINDVGRQMDILAASIYLRYLALCGDSFAFPNKAYTGEYILQIARIIYAKYGSRFYVKSSLILNSSQSKEQAQIEDDLDIIIHHIKKQLTDDYSVIYNVGLENILTNIRNDLAAFGIHFDNWVSERQFIAVDKVKESIDKLKKSGYTYEKEGAIWFNATHFGKKKDRVLVRSNGQHTYFANDIAYHLTKFDRGFDIAIDVFGADHQGYGTWMKAAMQASQIDPERLIHLSVQFVTLCQGGNLVPMSTRCGHFVMLRTLLEKVGNDAARFFYVMRRSNQYMDFDIDHALRKSNKNPVYYIQYAHVRMMRVLKQLEERGWQYDEGSGFSNLSLLKEKEERQLLNTLSLYPDMIMHAALNYEPHRVTHYLREAARDFHTYYHAHPFLVKSAPLRNARIALILASRQVLFNGLNLLGITAPESMSHHEKKHYKKKSNKP